MGITASALIEWLSTLDPDTTVGIGDSGTTLEAEGSQRIEVLADYIEVGMVPERVEPEPDPRGRDEDDGSSYGDPANELDERLRGE